ncbi:MAG TPA: DNA-3-methyladenine glycosylase 2 family protein [Ferrovibrio sp.]|uniref:DNA-3-methyladenine glycosylase family protein n=1 Tax=Ferrovibrio sp. TaxID=1917215 RepID=UPI002ECFDD5D
MRELIRKAGPFTLVPRRPAAPFPALLRSIVYQQLSGKAAATIHRRVLELFPGRGHPSPAQFLTVDDTALRAAGLSNNKSRAVRDLAERVLDGTVPSLRRLRGMDDEEIIARLTAVRGVGRWTVEMLLIFALGRPDILPLNDLGVHRGFCRVYGGEPDAAVLAARGEVWRPFRSVASWYLWRAADLPPESLPG